LAGKIIADIIEAPYDSIRMNVANVTVLTANNSGLTYLPTGNVNINVGSTTSLSLGNVTVSNLITANGGIRFPATQVSSANANTLDDYEEGTWTPTVGGNSTYSFQDGRYIKIGNLVWAKVRLTITTLGTGSTTIISGLPFASGSAVGGVGNSIGYFENMAVNVIAPVFFLGANSTIITVNGRASAGAGMTENLAVFGNSTRVDGVIIYSV
jgi:hypothetical protein